MLLQNEFFTLYLKENDDVVVRSKKKGYSLKSFDLVTREHPRLKITSFISLRKALAEIEVDHVIGSWLPLVEAIISPDKMVVEIMINATTAELQKNKKEVLMEVETALDELGICSGRKDLSKETFMPGKAVIGAEGTAPVKGADAVVKYIERPNRRPIMREDGSADYYEMNFVFQVKEGDWLGEKIPAKKGVDGIDVFGNTVVAARGSDQILHFDRKSVDEKNEGEKIVIRAMYGGTLEFQDEIVCVGKHITIEGDVGPETGAITFDGSVTVNGTVHAGYSVIATGDISIEGNEGITNAKMIHSSNGAVYIKGGVFGGDVTVVKAQGNVYLKHANNCKLYGKEVHVGLYLFGSEVVADHVYVNKEKGRIIGGTIKAVYGIESAIVGNNHERTTHLHVTGINVNELTKEIQKLAQELKDRQAAVEKLQAYTANIERITTGLSSQQVEVLKKTKETIKSNEEAIIEMDKEIQHMLKQIKTAEPESIEVVKEAFPGTVIRIGNASSNLYKKKRGVFKIVEGVLNV